MISVKTVIYSEGCYIVAHFKIQGESLTMVALYLEPQLSNSKVTDIFANVMEQITLGGNTRESINVWRLQSNFR